MRASWHLSGSADLVQGKSLQTNNLTHSQGTVRFLPFITARTALPNRFNQNGRVHQWQRRRRTSGNADSFWQKQERTWEAHWRTQTCVYAARRMHTDKSRQVYLHRLQYICTHRHREDKNIFKKGHHEKKLNILGKKKRIVGASCEQWSRDDINGRTQGTRAC